MNRPSRVAVQLLLICMISSLIHRFSNREASIRILREPYTSICKLAFVKQLGPSACASHLSGHPLTLQCRWDLRVHISSKLNLHRLVRSVNDTFSLAEVALLRQLDGCNSSATCHNETVACIHGIEDPSDAFWIREYNHESKFVVIFRVGLSSLIFFFTAIICEGSIFHPHRAGSFSPSSASMLAIIALASLLYVLVVPHHLQLALYGSGVGQSIGYVFLILMIAGTLPGLAVAWVSLCLFLIYFMGFFAEQVLCLLTGTLHYLGALSMYQAEITLFHLRLIYYRDIEAEGELDRRLLSMAERFLRRMRSNIFLYRIPTALEQDGLQVVQNTLPDRLFDELLLGSIPEVDFENLEDGSEDGGEDGTALGQQSTIRTPLLQRPPLT